MKDEKARLELNELINSKTDEELVEECYLLCTKLKSTSKKTEKRSILNSLKDNLIFKKFIHCIFEPTISYGIKKAKLDKEREKIGNSVSIGMPTSLFSIFNFLETNNTGRSQDVAVVARYINSFESKKELQDFLFDSFTKSLKLGVSESTFNEVWGDDFLTVMYVMNSHPYEKHLKSFSEGRKFTVTEKLDGVRIIIFHTANGVKCYTREGTEYTNLHEIVSEIKTLPYGVYDGEIIISNYYDYQDRNILQETLKVLKTANSDKGKLHYYCFDNITHQDYAAKRSADNYSARRARLETIFNNVEFNNISLLPPLYVGDNLEEVGELLVKYEAMGREGLMINFHDAHYLGKRNNGILKVKSMKTCDLQIIGFEQGKTQGKYSNTLGNLILDYKGRELRADGMSDSERDEIWNNQSSYLGAIAEISYFRESSNAKGELSISFPKFKRIRTDKNEPSYN